jgi:broad specificity phosphatase PhoE
VGACDDDEVTIHLVRHAPTAANTGGVFMGRIDVPALGLDSPAAYRIAPGRARTIYSSPMLRALSAADVLFPGEPVNLDDRLLERSVGDWEGLDHATVELRWPGTFIDGVIDPRAAAPGGESVADLCARVADFVGMLMSPESGPDSDTDVYVVTHNGWIRAAMLLNDEVELEELFAEPVPFLTPLRFAPDSTFGTNRPRT